MATSCSMFLALLLNLGLIASVVEGQKERGTTFDDESVERLWAIATQSEFDDEELELLKADLVDYDRRLKEHGDAVKQLEELDNEQQEHDNEIKEGDDDGNEDEHGGERALTKLKAKVKESHHLLRDQYRQFEYRAKLGSVKHAEFFDDKIEYFRNELKSANLTDEERELLVSYLQHFEEKAKEHGKLKEKLDYHVEKKAKSGVQMKRMSNRKKEEESYVHSQVKVAELSEGYKISFRYLKKLYHHLTKRMSGSRDEL